MANPLDKKAQDFRAFLKNVNRELEASKDDSETQETLYNAMLAKETEFRDILIALEAGRELYKKFIKFIVTKKKRILSARVYFRERQDALVAKEFTAAFRAEDPTHLFSLRINFMFVQWAGKRYRGPKQARIKALYEQITELRNTIITNDLPLAISRANKFYFKVPEGHMEHMDYYQACFQGACEGWNKCVPPYRSVFRSVAIGYMTLNMITEHNSTLIKMSPTDKRMLYRANLARYVKGMTDTAAILAFVKEKFPKATTEDIAGLTMAASTALNLSGAGTDEPGLDTIIPDPTDVEGDAIDNDQDQHVRLALDHLSVVERKVLRLRHGYN